MKLNGITEQEFIDKLGNAVKDEIKTSINGFEIYHLVKIDVKNFKQDISISDYVDEEIELMMNSFIKGKSEALNLGELDMELSVGSLVFNGFCSQELAYEFIKTHNLELDIISDNPIIREVKAPLLLYKKGLIDGIELMELPIIIVLDLY